MAPYTKALLPSLLFLLLPSLSLSSPISSCTTTTIITNSPQPAPSDWQPTWTLTFHTSTVTTAAPIDCHGCADIVSHTLIVDPFYSQGPPSYVFETAATPTTVTEGYCAAATPTPLSSYYSSGGGEKDERDAGCTTEIFFLPSLTFGPTKTVWTTTTTSTSTVDCGGCAEVAMTPIPLGVPPVAVFTTTTTAEGPSTTKVYECGVETAKGY